MLKQLRRPIIIAFICLAAAGCGPANVPLPTQKPVLPKNIVGGWQYTDQLDDTSKILLVLKPNGSFIQTRPLGPQSKRVVTKGKWILSGSSIQFFGLMAANANGNKIVKRNISFDVVDDGAGSFEIFGGDMYDFDRDAGDDFKKLW